MNPWLIFALLFLGIWLVFYIFFPKKRKEMLWTSLFTMPFGLTEPLFVPEYWSPPSLFDLAVKTGFDIESFIFCFSIGGIGAIFYELIYPLKHRRISKREKRQHRHHLLALLSPVLVFFPLYFFTLLNPIYSASIAMIIGGIATILCRPDLKRKILLGGVLFLCLYFLFFFLFIQIYPGIVHEVWNLAALSGILILGIPIEELIFAFSFGMLWSGVYEHVLWYRLVKSGIFHWWSVFS